MTVTPLLHALRDQAERHEYVHDRRCVRPLSTHTTCPVPANSDRVGPVFLAVVGLVLAAGSVWLTINAMPLPVDPYNPENAVPYEASP